MPKVEKKVRFVLGEQVYTDWKTICKTKLMWTRLFF